MKRWNGGTVERRNARLALAAIFAAVLVAAPAKAWSQDLGIEVGSLAPAAKVHTLDGKEADLSQYAGKTPVVM